MSGSSANGRSAWRSISRCWEVATRPSLQTQRLHDRGQLHRQRSPPLPTRSASRRSFFSPRPAGLRHSACQGKKTLTGRRAGDDETRATPAPQSLLSGALGLSQKLQHTHRQFLGRATHGHLGRQLGGPRAPSGVDDGGQEASAASSTLLDMPVPNRSGTTATRTRRRVASRPASGNWVSVPSGRLPHPAGRLGTAIRSVQPGRAARTRGQTPPRSESGPRRCSRSRQTVPERHVDVPRAVCRGAEHDAVRDGHGRSPNAALSAATTEMAS